MDRIAFVGTSNGESNIFAMNADGSNLIGLTNFSDNNPGGRPAWSPDNSKIAFTRGETGPNFSDEIWVMNADGSNLISLTNTVGDNSEPTWSPDGTRIAFTSRRDGNYAIYVMQANGTNQTRITSTLESDDEPDWSPDGTRIAFRSSRGGGDIYVMNVDGSNPTRLTNNNNTGGNQFPDWSPSGAKIAYTNAPLLGDIQIFVMNADGSNPTPLANTPNGRRPAWSPDGAQIAFDSRSGGSTTEIYVVNADGSNLTRLTHSEGAIGAAWRPHATPRNPLIFVPGVSGSVLVNHPLGSREELWLGVPDFLPFSADRKQLTLDASDPNFQPTIDATDAVRYVRIGGTAVKPVYGPLLEYLTTQGVYREYQVNGFPFRRTTAGADLTQKSDDPNLNPNLFVFAYDWRKSNVENAAKLAEYVNVVRMFYPDSDVDILTHSMGSLLARRYVLDHPSDNHVDKLVTIGAPWLGAPKLLHVLETGNFIKDGPLNIAAGPDIKFVMATLTAAHQLLTSKSYFDLGGARILREDGWDFNGDGWDQETYSYDDVIDYLDTFYPATTPGTTAANFHTFDQDNWSLDASGIDYFHIYGVQSRNQTIESMIARTEIISAGLVGVATLNVLDLRFTSGDGTSPTISASRMGSSDLNAPGAELFRFDGATSGGDDLVEHTGLTQNPLVQSKVLDLLRGAASVPFAQAFAAVAAPAMNPLYYVSLYGGTSLTVSDSEGNSTGLIAGDLLGAVPGVSNYTLGDHAEMAILPVADAETYQVTFATDGGPIALKIVKGVDTQTPTELIRYEDLMLPPGTQVRLLVTPQGVDNLAYDSDGNGAFETIVAPTVAVSSATPLDVTPPVITAGRSVHEGTTRLTLNASDDDAGLKDLMFSLDGVHFQPYAGPVGIDAAQHPLVYAYAEDNLGNRTSRMTFDVATVGAALSVNIAPVPTAQEGATVALAGATLASIGSPANLHLSIDWGDGTIEPGSLVSSTSGAAVTSTHVYRDNGTYTVILQAGDAAGDTAQGMAVVHVTNALPSATLLAPASVIEGSPIVVSLVDPNDPGAADAAAGFTYAFDTADGSGFGAYSALSPFTLSTTDNGVRTVRGRIQDKDGGVSEYTATITIINAAPAVDTGSNASLLRGAPLTRSGSFADPGSDSWVARVDYGDATGVQPLALSPGKTFTLNHSYTAAGAFTVTVSVDDGDGDGGVGQSAFVVVVTAPVTTIQQVSTTTSRGNVSSLVLTSSDALDPNRARDIKNYTLLGAGRDLKFGTKDDVKLTIASAAYDTGAHTITLTPSGKLASNTPARLTVLASNPATGVTDVQGRLIDGNDDGNPGLDFVGHLGPIPYVKSQKTTSARTGITGVVLTFNQPLDARRAQNLASYRLITAGADGRFGTADDQGVALKKAVYKSSNKTVTLTTSSPQSKTLPYQLTVSGTSADTGLADTGGALLDGNRDGASGGNYVGRLGAIASASVSARAYDLLVAAGKKVAVPVRTLIAHEMLASSSRVFSRIFGAASTSR